MVDIDNFKRLNDQYGHAIGDECLRCFGTLLKNFERMLNVKFYRYGGEEFVALVWGCDQKGLLHICESIRTSAQKRQIGPLDITISIGATICNTEENGSYEYWINQADKACYKAKEKGRNRVEI